MEKAEKRIEKGTKCNVRSIVLSTEMSAEELKKQIEDAKKDVEEKAKDDEEEGGVCAFFKARKGRPGSNMRKRAGKPLTSSTKDHKKPRPEEDAPGHTWESTRSAVITPPPNF